MIVVRIDIKDRSEVDRVIEIQNGIKITSAPTEHREYPAYDKAKAFSPAFVEYINELLTEVPPDEKALFDRWAPLGMMSKEVPGEMELKEIQSGIDSAYIAIQEELKIWKSGMVILQRQKCLDHVNS